MKYLILLSLCFSSLAEAKTCPEQLAEWLKLEGLAVNGGEGHLRGQLLAAANRIEPTEISVKQSRLERLRPDLLRFSLSNEKVALVLFSDEVGSVLAYRKKLKAKKAELWCSRAVKEMK